MKFTRNLIRNFSQACSQGVTVMVQHMCSNSILRYVDSCPFSRWDALAPTLSPNGVAASLRI